MTASSPGRVLVLDNRDSFVFNLVDELHATGARVETVRSSLPLERLETRLRELDPHLVVLSPGPGRPEEGGVMVEWLASDPEVPVLGICLGHQALAVAAGGEVGRAPRPVHGRTDRVTVRRNDAVLGDRGTHLVAARYHSLVVTSVPASMEVVATVEQEGSELVMALRSRDRCRLGLQFHPESILTPHGRHILWRFYEEARRYGGERCYPS